MCSSDISEYSINDSISVYNDDNSYDEYSYDSNIEYSISVYSNNSIGRGDNDNNTDKDDNNKTLSV